MAEPVDDIHHVVVDEVGAGGAAWREILEGVRLLKRKGKSTTVAGAISIALRFRISVEVRCIENEVFWVWLQAAWLTEAEHRAYVPDIGSL